MNSLVTISFFIEVAIFLGAVYLYLYSAGILNMKKFRSPKDAEAFRKETGGWLRPLSLALAAIMFFNLVMRFMG